MLTPNDVKLQLMEHLPRYTQEFCDSSTASSASVSGSSVVVISSSHGLDTGDIITVSGFIVKIPISSVSYDSDEGLATLTCSFEHDRTSVSDDTDVDDYNVASLSGFDTESYNDDFNIISATRTTLTIETSEDAFGTLGYMQEDRSVYFGFAEVTKIDNSTFSIEVADDLPDGAVISSFSFTSNQRIYITADATRAVTSFGQHIKDPSLYIIFGQEVASKDRGTETDAIMTATWQNPLYVTYMNNVSLLAVAKTEKDHHAATQVQKTYEEIKPAIRQVMFGHIFNADQDDGITRFCAIEAGNTPERYNTGHYVHSFDYEIPYRICFEQGNMIRKTVSFRDLVINCKMFNNEGTDAESSAEVEI